MGSDERREDHSATGSSAPFERVELAGCTSEASTCVASPVRSGRIARHGSVESVDE